MSGILVRTLSQGALEAVIPQHVLPTMRALLVQTLHAGGGLTRTTISRHDGKRTRRKIAWRVGQTEKYAGDATVRALVKRGLMLKLLTDDGTPPRARLTLAGHWYAETLDAQWQRGKFDPPSTPGDMQ